MKRIYTVCRIGKSGNQMTFHEIESDEDYNKALEVVRKLKIEFPDSRICIIEEFEILN